MEQLVNWKNTHKRKALIVTGAKSVGKTYIIREFAKNNYKAFYEVNFLLNKNFCDVFDAGLSPETILTKLSLKIKNFKLIEGSTLIFLDNLEFCPEALTALKFLAEDSRFDVIGCGTYMYLAYSRTSSYPVGYVNTIKVEPLDFEEFLWARGVRQEVIDYTKEFYDSRKEVDSILHNKMFELFKEYMVIGGMPEAVNEFNSTNNFSNVLKVQKNILKRIRSDIVKYNTSKNATVILSCFNGIPIQLKKKNKKFQYSLVEKKINHDKVLWALEWLNCAGLINYSYKLNSIEEPFIAFQSFNCFKVYMNDTGLLVAMLDEGASDKIMSGNLGIYKGAIDENIIAEVFTKLGKKLYYFEKNSTLEIDFFIRYNNQVTAVLVKSADNTKSKSLKSVMENYGVKSGLKLSSKNLGSNNENVISLPIYMSMFL